MIAGDDSEIDAYSRKEADNIFLSAYNLYPLEQRVTVNEGDIFYNTGQINNLSALVNETISNPLYDTEPESVVKVNSMDGLTKRTKDVIQEDSVTRKWFPSAVTTAGRNWANNEFWMCYLHDSLRFEDFRYLGEAPPSITHFNGLTRRVTDLIYQNRPAVDSSLRTDIDSLMTNISDPLTKVDSSSVTKINNMDGLTKRIRGLIDEGSIDRNTYDNNPFRLVANPADPTSWRVRDYIDGSNFTGGYMSYDSVKLFTFIFNSAKREATVNITPSFFNPSYSFGSGEYNFIIPQTIRHNGIIHYVKQVGGETGTGTINARVNIIVPDGVNVEKTLLNPGIIPFDGPGEMNIILLGESYGINTGTKPRNEGFNSLTGNPFSCNEICVRLKEQVRKGFVLGPHGSTMLTKQLDNQIAPFKQYKQVLVTADFLNWCYYPSYELNANVSEAGTLATFVSDITYPQFAAYKKFYKLMTRV